MSAEDLENFEADVELSMYREYRDVVSQFSYVVETERRFYLANAVELIPNNSNGEVYFEVRMSGCGTCTGPLDLLSTCELSPLKTSILRS